MSPFLIDFLTGASFLALALVIVMAAKLINDFFIPYLIDVQLARHDNTALAVSFAGYLLGVIIIFIGAFVGPSYGLVGDLLRVGGWSLGGVFLLNLSRVINDKLILYKFSNVKEIIDDRNVGTGVVQAGSYLASGFMVAGAINGEGGGILTALAFFFAGQTVLVLFGLLYEKMVPYEVQQAIEDDNVAAGLAFAGALVAIGIVLAHASGGAFVGWGDNFVTFLREAALVIILFPFVRFCFDKIVLAKIDLNREISEDGNVGAAILEASSMVAFATVLVFIFG
ncbi:DUF350 domain-containing protein [Puniceicoccus vermicola]|uniref:DUF350 domain-containing protein n=1 Tax=Puniceicoccus vermicola TaxID=388746 RepID=A0A7X1B0H9_9BACT|nr:DUF350 domain-containing protein [Puniceicoccus vermicola]MBC2603371.1 DUF350 domain-containing protein [Puniceicoccus vermicola]